MTQFKKNSIIVRRIYNEQQAKSKHHIHNNEGHELYMLLQGEVSFSIDGCFYKLEPHDMLLISNQEIHRTIVNPEMPYERIYMYFDPDLFAQFNMANYNLLQLFENRKQGFGNKIGREIVERYRLKEHFEEMYEWYQSKAPEREIMMISILLRLLVTINTICCTYEEEERIKEDVGYNDKIYRVIRYISSRLDKKITLEELEKEFFINKYHLCHLFKNVTGFTIVEYMNYKKILAAKEQLKKGKPISEVWIHLGFEDYSSFYRTFKKIVGISPKQYGVATFGAKSSVKAQPPAHTT